MDTENIFKGIRQDSMEALICFISLIMNSNVVLSEVVVSGALMLVVGETQIGPGRPFNPGLQFDIVQTNKIWRAYQFYFRDKMIMCYRESVGFQHPPKIVVGVT